MNSNTASNTNAGSGNTPNTSANNSGQQSSGGQQQRGRRNCNNNHNRGTSSSSKFKGKCEELSGHIYDIGTPGITQDLFTNTMREIAEYVACVYSDASEFGVALPNLRLEPLVQPQPPVAPQGGQITLAQMEMFKIDLKDYREKEKNRLKNTSKIFFLVLGQCTRAVRDRLEASDQWNDIYNGTELMQLMALIRTSMYDQVASRWHTHSYVEAENIFMRARQTENMSNSEYLEKFKGMLEVFEHVGGIPGVCPQRVEAFMEPLGNLDPDDPDDEDAIEALRATARRRAREEYLGVRFILMSNKK